MSATGFGGVKGTLASLGGFAAPDSASSPSHVALIRAAGAARTLAH
jgi:hypothetical protein